MFYLSAFFLSFIVGKLYGYYTVNIFYNDNNDNDEKNTFWLAAMLWYYVYTKKNDIIILICISNWKEIKNNKRMRNKKWDINSNVLKIPFLYLYSRYGRTDTD